MVMLLRLNCEANSKPSPTKNSNGSINITSTVSAAPPAVTETILPMAPVVLPRINLPGIKS